MKTLLIIFATCIIAGATASAQPAQGKAKKLLGKWESVEDKSKGATLEFIDSSTVLLTYLGEKKKISGIRIDLSKSPGWFDFTVNTGDETITMKTLIHFVHDDLLKWQVFVEEQRPSHFTTQAGEVLYLKRKREATSVARNE